MSGPVQRLCIPAGALALVMAWLVTGCAEAPSAELVIDEPATVTPVEGSDLARITLTDAAVARLDLRTEAVEEQGARTVVPSGALMVDPQGGFWVYTSPEPHLFMREQVRVEREEADLAYLSDGPAAGTEVVTVGAAQLYGVETGIGH